MDDIKATKVEELIEEKGTKVETLTTKDIYFASALHSLGVELTGRDATDVAHQRFPFSGEHLTDLETQWINGTLIGNLSIYAESIRKVKSLIHSYD